MAEERQWQVEFYEAAGGRVPAREFLHSLSPGEYAAALRAFGLLREFGMSLGMPHARPVAGMWELRAGPGRFFYFAHTGRRFIVLHGYRKKTQKAPAREIETARRRLADFLEREA